MTLEKTLRFIALGGIFVLPFVVFIVTSSLYFPFITGKNFAFRVIVEVITGAWLALALINTQYRPRRSWLLASFAAFLIIIAAADFFGAYPFKSFWSNFERMEGWVTLAHLFLYFIVAGAMLSTEKLWTRFFQVSLGVSTLVGIHALLQLFGVVSLNPGFSSIARLDATFGNPIYLAAYMLFHVFIAAFLLARSWEENSRRSRSETYLYGGIIIFDTLILFLTGTRGAILGLVGGVVLASLLFIFRGNSGSRARTIAIGAIVAILVSALGVYLVRDQEWVRSVPILSRLATISISEQTAQARIMNWGSAWQGVKERPILGWGQENFAVVFNKYYNPGMYNQEQWFDRVHSVIFDWLVAGGFLGLFAYLSLYVFAVLYIWRRKNGITAFTVPEQSILTGLLAAYFFHNLFVFDNITSYILFGSVLAFIAYRAGSTGHAQPILSGLSLPPRSFPIVVVGVVALVWGGTWFVNANALAANKALLQALAPHPEGVAKNLEYFKKSISYGSYGTQEAREQLVQVAVQLAGNQSVPVELKQQFLQTAASEMALQGERSPLDPRFPLFLGSLLNTYGFYAEAATALEKARTLAPKKQTVLFEVASNAFVRGDTQKALALFKEAHELAPQFPDARLYYASVAIRVGQDALADELLAPAVTLGYAADPRIAMAYITRNRYDKIISIWKAHLGVAPNDVQAHLTLSDAYVKSGNRQQAIEQLEEAARLNPGAKAQIDEYLRTIREGGQ